jgi:hypothetical protein
MPDFRDRWLFVAGVGMSWLAISPVLQRELFLIFDTLENPLLPTRVEEDRSCPHWPP